MSKKCLRRVFTARYTFAILTSLSLGLVYTFKILVSVALLFIIDTADLYNDTPKPKECTYSIVKRVPDGPLDESHFMQGVLHASYYIGFLVSQIPLALLAEHFSAKCVMMIAIMGNTVCAFVSPTCVKLLPFKFFCALRGIQGFLSGGAVPAANVMIGRWCPPEERYVMYGIVYSGPGLGVVFGTVVPGLLGWFYVPWDWMFYSPAILSLIVTMLFLFFVGEAPWSAQFISEKERVFITGATEGLAKQEPHKFPWLESCSSCRFWAIAFSHFCSNVGWYFIITTLPSFLKWVLHRQEVQIIMMLAAAYFACFIFSLDMSVIEAILLEGRKISVTSFRKVANGIGSLIPAMCFILLPFIQCNPTVACIILIVAITSVGSLSSGVIPNCIDIAPNFAGMLIVNSNTFATLPGIFVPILIGWELDNHGDMYQYLLTFLFIGAMYIVMFLVYTMFGTAEVQPWNYVEENQEL